MTTIPAKGYVASDSTKFLYPAIGDPQPPGGSKVLLLTIGGVCVTGTWQNNGHFLGWAPMPKRDKTKEQQLCASSPYSNT